MRCASLLLIILVAAALSAPCWAQKQISDDVIYDRVRLKLAGDPIVKGGALQVEVSQGVVTLRGRVHSEKARTKAGQLAKKVSGVKKVVNQLRVEPVAPRTSEQQS